MTLAARLSAIYRRCWPFIRAVPGLAALPFAAEMLQHIYEISAGLYEAGALSPEARRSSACSSSSLWPLAGGISTAPWGA
jgi:hypothetical protein